MSEKLSPTRRALLATSAAAGVASAFSGYLTPAAASDAIRPFRVNVPEEALADLRRRLAQTRLPDRETVADHSQGVPLKTVEQLLRYWQTDYNWRKVEARINAVPNFITEIDGVDIHFIHARSKHENALPLIVTHGWPGSVIEQLKIIEPLTNPTAHGGSASDAFHLVIPSIPGYGFSGKPTTTGWGPERIASAWITLMTAPWLQALRRPGRRLGRGHHRCDRRAVAAGTARHSHQHARRHSCGYRPGIPGRCVGAVRSLR